MLGKVIIKLLKANSDLLNLIPSTKMFPYIVDEDTALPCLVYTIDSMVPQYTKDGWHLDSYTFSIRVFSGQYDELQNIVLKVREALEFKKGEYEFEDAAFKSIEIQSIRLVGMDEGFNFFENILENRMSFSVNIIDWET